MYARNFTKFILFGKSNIILKHIKVWLIRVNSIREYLKNFLQLSVNGQVQRFPAVIFPVSPYNMSIVCFFFRSTIVFTSGFFGFTVAECGYNGFLLVIPTWLLLASLFFTI